MNQSEEVVVFGGGCFWCTEAVFVDVRGVISVMPGYAGGSVEHPTYDAVCSGRTGHAEVVRVTFDPARISFEDLLTIFFATHDPTTLHRQGNDVGTQYRSVIFFTTDRQRDEALQFISRLSADDDSSGTIVTEVVPLSSFYPAEDYHREYYKYNSSQPYCQLVISPKLKKLKERYRALLKE
ncbi:MAG: peptide-methionine (S)-S-oxide reductase [Candidatus Parcubacteria bacterium]|jgi:peptide-methionine (S)-S-oxide reductase